VRSSTTVLKLVGATAVQAGDGVLVALVSPVNRRVTAVTRLSEAAAAVSRDRDRRPQVTGSIRVPRSMTVPRPTDTFRAYGTPGRA
jgi:hypothetical protein